MTDAPSPSPSDYEAEKDALLNDIEQLTKRMAKFVRDSKPKPSPPEGYTTAEVATALLKLHRGSLDRLVDKGRIRTVQDNWRVYYKLTDLLKQVEIHALQEKIDRLREPDKDNE